MKQGQDGQAQWREPGKSIRSTQQLLMPTGPVGAKTMRENWLQLFQKVHSQVGKWPLQCGVECSAQEKAGQGLGNTEEVR